MTRFTLSALITLLCWTAASGELVSHETAQPKKWDSRLVRIVYEAHTIESYELWSPGAGPPVRMLEVDGERVHIPMGHDCHVLALGPTLNPEQAADAIRWLLDQNSYDTSLEPDNCLPDPKYALEFISDEGRIYARFETSCYKVSFLDEELRIIGGGRLESVRHDWDQLFSELFDR